ncbi:putative galacturonosyltransferase 14 [Hordeum vulgare]|nr:putative galacturonosyltransferase 14 [Hordeum vulgare]
MEDPMLSPVTVEVVHAPSPRADLVASHVDPAVVAQAHAAPSRKRHGNVVVQGGNPAAPAATARAPGASDAVRARPAAEKTGKAAGVKRRKVPASRKPPYSTSGFFHPQGGAPAMPFNDAAPPASEVFDEMTRSGCSNNATTEFVNMLDTNAADIDQASFEPFYYNETDGGVDDHGCADELEEIEAEAFEQSQAKGEKSQRSKNYAILEDQALIQAWSVVFLDACTGVSETAKRYWQNIEDQYFRIMKKYPNRTPRTFRSLQGRRENIKSMCTRWATCLEQLCIMSMNRNDMDDLAKSMSLLLTEENKIMSMNRNDMDDLTKIRHDMARREILKRRMVASAGPFSSSGDVFSAPYGANVDDFGAGVGISDGGGFGGADEL